MCSFTSTSLKWLLFLSLISICIIPIASAPAVASAKTTQLTIHYFYQKPYVSLNELRLELPLTYRYSEAEGTLTIKHAGQTYELLRGTTVIARNGIHLPINAKPWIDIKKQTTAIYLPLSVIEKAFALPISARSNQSWTVRTDIQPGQIQTVFTSPIYKKHPQIQLKSASPKQIADYLSFLKSPIEGAKLSARDNHLPGAPRTYRNGTHEGLDWYSNYSGIRIDRKTAVRSMARGIVVRIDNDYTEMKRRERETLLGISARAKQTPVFILDKMRGRSVWVQYEKGVLVRYAHLDSVNKKLSIGSALTVGSVIGTVGNSGTSSGVAGNNEDLHLHMDVLINNELFWKYLKRPQIREVLANVFRP